MAEQDQNQSQNVQEESINSMDKLMEIYDQISSEQDETARLADFLTITNYYNFALKVANEVNGRQGKARVTVNERTVRLMGYSLDTDVSEVTDKMLQNLYLDIINAYLQDKQDLPSDRPRTAQGIISRVKALFIMLVSSNKSWVIPMIDPIPRYMLKITRTLFDQLQLIRNDAVNSFIAYLEKSGNDKLAEIVRSAGNKFWGTEGSKANEIYEYYTRNIMTEIKDPKKTYEMYLYFRSQYRKSTINIMPSRIYEIFEITPDAYRRAKEKVYDEIRELFPQSEYAKSIKELLYES
jgi:hypothetical protein